MRDFMNIIEAALQESVDFHPAKLEIRDGHSYIEYPDTGKEKITPCPECEHAKEYDPNYTSEKCIYCHGEGVWRERVYDFPQLNVSNFQCAAIADMLGVGMDDEDSSGWIPHSDLPQVMRRLIMLKNGDSSHYTHDNTETGGETFVDRSGDVPAIKKTMTMIGGGRDQSQINQYIDRLIAMVKWAQEHGCGVSWA